MGIFWPFKRSRREVNRSNQEQGKAGEEQVKREYEMRGHDVERTGKGHDFKVSKRNWLTGKKEIKYVEVKTGNSPLSPLQKKKKRQMGSKYVEERVQPNPLSYSINAFSSNSSKKTRLDANSILGTTKRKTKKKSTPSTSSSWGWGSTPKSKTKKKSKPSTSSSWGWGSTKSKGRKKADSTWGL